MLFGPLVSFFLNNLFFFTYTNYFTDRSTTTTTNGHLGKATTTPVTMLAATQMWDKWQGHRGGLDGGKGSRPSCLKPLVLFFFLFLWTTLTIYLGFQTMGPKRWCNHRLVIVIHTTINTATSPHQATSNKFSRAAGDEGSRPARLEPFVVCFFFYYLFSRLY